MRIKKFTGATVKEATTKMKRDLGPDAIVLGSRKVSQGGIFSFLGKEMVEITAAIDDAPVVTAGSKERRNIPSSPARYVDRTLGNEKPKSSESEIENTIENLRKVAERFQNRDAEPVRGPEAGIKSKADISQYQLQKEMGDIKNTLMEIADRMKYDKMPSLPDNLKRAYISLIDKDVSEKIAADIVQSVYMKLDEQQVFDKKITENEVISEMANLINTVSAPKKGRRKAKVVALVGPTGVGKTTTIAKLAAINKLLNKKEVGLISVDTYRIGAIEQLRTFAAIADIPMEVVYKSSEIALALRKFRDKDLIFIDTVGRSQRVKKELNELKRFVDTAKPDEIHLVISASTGFRTMMDIAEKFKVLQPNRIIFSKLDEAVSFGSMVSVAHKQRVPISYITTGQNVPEDINAADSNEFAAMVYSGVLPDA